MGQTKRDKLKRKVAQSHNNIDSALRDLMDLEAEFAPDHPDYAEALQVMAQYLLQVQAWLIMFWTKAWGKPPGDIDAWRG